MNMLLTPCDSQADVAFLTRESDEYPPMSGANTIATTIVLLETGFVPIRELITVLLAVKGRAWLTGFRQSMLDPTDPFPIGYCMGDHWPSTA